jgi:hypothetical protein
MNLESMLNRVIGILTAPKREWPVIACEQTTPAGLYKGYLLFLALIPAVGGFVKQSIVGISVPFAGTVRAGFGQGLSTALVSYLLILLAVYLIALITDFLAPSFGAQKNREQAVKTIGYAYTASLCTAIGQLVPWIGMPIVFSGAVYSFYLLYLGLPETMKCPRDRAVGYTVSVAILSLVLNLLLGAVIGPVAGMSTSLTGGTRSIATAEPNDMHFDKNSMLGRLGKWSKKMEDAQKSEDSKAQGEAMMGMLGTLLGGGEQVAALEPDRLKRFLPMTLAGLSRADFSVERNAALGLQFSEAKATYREPSGRSIQLEINDMGSVKGVMALAGWAGARTERESDRGYEKTYEKDGHLIHERWDEQSHSGEYGVVLGERFVVKVSGVADNVDQLKSALISLDLVGLEALRQEGVKKE